LAFFIPVIPKPTLTFPRKINTFTNPTRFTTMTQEYEKYTPQDLLVWQLLFDHQMRLLPSLASPAYLAGIEKVGFQRDRIPNFDEMNAQLAQITGWRVEVVEGLIPNKAFFELLENRRFPASTWLRKMDQLAYLEEPDMFHDVFGHVPLLSNQDFCNFLGGLSQVALRFIDSELAIELISRLYWYTVEFGLIEDADGLKIYGAGILSSQGESVYCLGDQPQRVRFDVAEIIITPYIKEKFQEKYFVIHAYRELMDALPELARLIAQQSEEGRLYDTILSRQDFEDNFENIPKSINESALVVANTKISKVPKGSIGTVVHVYENKDAYEVEFIVNDSSIVETVFSNQIEEKVAK